LAEQLAELIEEVKPAEIPFEITDAVVFGIGELGGGGEGLWAPILALALSRIDVRVVAQALLIQTGKWAPGPIPDIK
jgi:hypothetical protein